MFKNKIIFWILWNLWLLQKKVRQQIPPHSSSSFVAVVGSGIRDTGRKETTGSGMFIPDPQHCYCTYRTYLSELASMAGGRAHTRQEGIFSSVIFISLSPPPPAVSTPTDSGSTTGSSFSSSSSPSSPARLPRWKAAREGWLRSQA